MYFRISGSSNQRSGRKTYGSPHTAVLCCIVHEGTDTSVWVIRRKVFFLH